MQLFKYLKKFRLKTLFEMNEHFLEVLNGSVVGFSVKIIGAGIAFFMHVMLSRQLGASDAGVFFLGLALMMVIASISRLGLDNALIRFISLKQADKQWGEINYLTHKAFLFSFFFSVVLGFALWNVAGYLSSEIFDDPRLRYVLRCLSIVIPCVAIYTLQASAFQGLKKIIQSNVILSVILPCVVLVLLIGSPVTSLHTAVVYYLTGSVVTLFVAIFLWKKQSLMKVVRKSFDLTPIVESCKSLWLIQFLVLVNMWSGQIFLGIWSESSDIAIFNATQRIVMLISFILIAVNGILAPKYSALYENNDMKAIALLSMQTTRLMLVASLPLMLVIFFFPAFLLGIFGDDFISGVDVLMVLLFGQFINMLTGAAGNLLVMTGNERILKNITMISTVISVVFSIVLIPVYGAMGAAIAFSMMMVLSNVWCVYAVKKQLGFFITPFRLYGGE